MKHMLLALFSTFYMTVFSQITVTNATFPAVGDTLKFARDGNTAISNAITAPGGPQNWDFSGLQFESQFSTIYQPASAGSQVALFPGAGLVSIGQQGETFYKKSSTKFESLGYAGADPANLGLNVTAKFSPPVVLRRSPMNFFDVNQIETNLVIPFKAADLPDSLFSGFPGANAIDSVRFRINYLRLDVVDGFGNLKIPGANFDVLREKRTEYTTTHLDVKVPLFGWQTLGDNLFNFLGTDTTVTHRFVNDKEKEDIAVLNLSNDGSGLNSVVFKDMLATSANHEIDDAPGKANIQAYPNPAVETVSFYCKNLNHNEYTLKIFNIVGKTVWKNVEWMSGDRVISLDLENFKKGPYLYSLTDREGKIVATKRLVILKP